MPPSKGPQPTRHGAARSRPCATLLHNRLCDLASRYFPGLGNLAEWTTGRAALDAGRAAFVDFESKVIWIDEARLLTPDALLIHVLAHVDVKSTSHEETWLCSMLNAARRAREAGHPELAASITQNAFDESDVVPELPSVEVVDRLVGAGRDRAP